jgi:hypothetical protein
MALARAFREQHLAPEHALARFGETTVRDALNHA